VSGPSIYDITPKMGRELKSLAEKPETDIDLSDVPETINWDQSVIGKFYRPIKRPVSIRVDADVLAWFRAQGGMYQSTMNQALREYMKRHQPLKKRA